MLSPKTLYYYVDAGPLPSSAWAGWKGFGSEVEVEAAKGVLYCTTVLCPQLTSCYLRCMPAAEERDYYVMYSIDSIHLILKG